MIDSWKNKVILQQPDWTNKKQLQTILEQIHNYPKLVSKDEIWKTYLQNDTRNFISRKRWGGSPQHLPESRVRCPNAADQSPEEN